MRNIRNFWIECTIDGRESALTVGPRNKDGGFALTVFAQDKGNVSLGVNLCGYVDAKGQLVLEVRDSKGQIVINQTTTR